MIPGLNGRHCYTSRQCTILARTSKRTRLTFLELGSDGKMQIPKHSHNRNTWVLGFYELELLPNQKSVINQTPISNIHIGVYKKKIYIYCYRSSIDKAIEIYVKD